MSKYIFFTTALFLTLASAAFPEGLQYSLVNDLLTGRAKQQTITTEQSTNMGQAKLPKGRVFVTRLDCYTAPIPANYGVPTRSKVTMSFVKSEEDTPDNTWVVEPEREHLFEEDILATFSETAFINNRSETYFLQVRAPYRVIACSANVIVYH